MRPSDVMLASQVMCASRVKSGTHHITLRQSRKTLYNCVEHLSNNSGEVDAMLEQIRTELFRLQDVSYRDFLSRLLPTVAPETVIGVRTPALRALAKTLLKEADVSPFLRALPHAYFDETSSTLSCFAR